MRQILPGLARLAMSPARPISRSALDESPTADVSGSRQAVLRPASYTARVEGAAYSRGGHPARRRPPSVVSDPGVKMSNPHAAQGSAATAKQKLTFKQMSPRQKT